jgi:3-mercaptopyruvate sulfurtransferase SseA
MGLMVRAAVVAVGGLVLGVAANFGSPRPAALGRPVFPTAELPGAACQDPGSSVARISVQEAKPLCVACAAVFVDVRSAQEYASGHVTGALHLRPDDPVEPLLPKLGVAPMVIVYDRDRECAAADQVAALLKAKGVRDVRVLTGAWPDWLAAGGPGESGTCALCTAEGR